MYGRTLIAFLLVVGTGSASAQPETAPAVVQSDGPSSVSVTVYRDPFRDPDDQMESSYLEGYALITEQRTITLPAGEVNLRFEGVAGGIIPQSAIVTGLADGVLEKNRDAALLSPSALLNGHLGKAVTIRRTSAATGRTAEFDAKVRSDASGGVVLQTAEGFEALQCTGLNEALIFPEIPPGLSAKPTLSVRTRVAQPTRTTITLSYLATGFDWQANYVADVSADGKTMALFSWVTLANGDETSFLDAQTNAVAGQPNKEEDDISPARGGRIALRCWPQATTSDVAVKRFERARAEARFAGRPMPAPVMAMEAAADQIMVTARSNMAKQEDLGDLKLYRIPVPVTVAAQSQKQVAMFEKSEVQFEQIYQAELDASRSYDQPRGLETTLRLQNRKRDGLGLAMPAGRLVAFREAGGARLMLGEGSIDDKAIGEEVDITINRSPLVRYAMETVDETDGDARKYADKRLTITNASPRAAKVEIKIWRSDEERITRASSKLGRKDGRDLWSVTVPANSRRSLSFRLNRR